MDALWCRMPARQRQENNPQTCSHFLVGADPVPIPYTKTSPTQTGLVGLRCPATTVLLRQRSCSNSLLDQPSPSKGLRQYPRESGARKPPPIPKGSARGTETSQHMYSAPSISEVRFKGLFAIGGGCTRTGGEQREAPAPPALCLSAE